ncbi:hypothetical protein BDV3_003824 [Batrachochytrium dendrobatidis]
MLSSPIDMIHKHMAMNVSGIYSQYASLIVQFVSHSAPRAESQYSDFVHPSTVSKDQYAYPSPTFIQSIILNSVGSTVMMLVIMASVQAIQEYLHARPTVYKRFPSLPTTKPSPGHSLTVSMMVSTLFGISMALLGIYTTNPLPNSLAVVIFRLVLTLVVYDFGLYIVHTMQHHFGPFIPFHREHHGVSMYATDVTNGALPDFLEAFIPLLIVPALLKFNIAEVWAIAFALQIHGAIAHAGCSMPGLDWWDFVLVGPRFHAAHHVFHRGNYGTLFSIWDHAFGTAVSIEKSETKLWKVLSKNK